MFNSRQTTNALLSTNGIKSGTQASACNNISKMLSLQQMIGLSILDNDRRQFNKPELTKTNRGVLGIVQEICCSRNFLIKLYCFVLVYNILPLCALARCFRVFFYESLM